VDSIGKILYGKKVYGGIAKSDNLVGIFGNMFFMGSAGQIFTATKP